jgi:hypothetical protein
MSAVPTPELLAIVRAAILAKQAYWDATIAIEKILVPDDEVSDRQADLITEICETYAIPDIANFGMKELEEFLDKFQSST